MNYKKYIIFGVIIALILFVSWYFWLTEYISLEKLKEEDHIIKAWVQNHYWVTVFGYIGIYILSIIVCLPLAIALTMIGGYLFGVKLAVAYSSFAATTGSLASFILFKHGLFSGLHKKYGTKIATLKDAVQKNGASYLIMLHAFMVPFFIINILAALAHIPVTTFIWTTIIGSFPLVLISALAGDQLTSLSCCQDGTMWMHLAVMVGLLLLVALIPLLIKKYREEG